MNAELNLLAAQVSLYCRQLQLVFQLILKFLPIPFSADIATTLVLAATPPINPVIPFRANRPFVYFVRDRTEKSILFSGYVKKPVPPSSECSQQSEGQV